jgi:hypothetical protein
MSFEITKFLIISFLLCRDIEEARFFKKKRDDDEVSDAPEASGAAAPEATPKRAMRGQTTPAWSIGASPVDQGSVKTSHKC